MSFVGGSERVAERAYSRKVEQDWSKSGQGLLLSMPVSALRRYQRRARQRRLVGVLVATPVVIDRHVGTEVAKDGHDARDDRRVLVPPRSTAV